MAKQTHKAAVVISIGFDERRYGAFRAVKYDNVIGIYHDRDPRKAVAAAQTWGEASRWCRKNA